MLKAGTLYEIEDVKVLIICTLAKLDRPVPTRLMVDMFLNTDVVEYFTLAQSIADLIETGHIASDVDEGITVLTRLGYEAARELYTQVPLYVRERALKGARGLLGRIERQAGVTTRVDMRDGRYYVRCALDESGDELLKLELLSPTRELSYIIEENFKDTAYQLYTNMINILSRPVKQDDEE